MEAALLAAAAALGDSRGTTTRQTGSGGSDEDGDARSAAAASTASVGLAPAVLSALARAWPGHRRPHLPTMPSPLRRLQGQRRLEGRAQPLAQVAARAPQVRLPVPPWCICECTPRARAEEVHLER